MAETKFTKGPWFIEDPMGDALSICVGDPSKSYDWRFVAHVLRDEARGRSSAPAIHKTQQEANAALIAASPDLYWALTQALGVIVEFADINGFRNLSNEELGRAVKSVAETSAAALSKARGE